MESANKTDIHSAGLIDKSKDICSSVSQYSPAPHLERLQKCVRHRQFQWHIRKHWPNSRKIKDDIRCILHNRLESVGVCKICTDIVKQLRLEMPRLAYFKRLLIFQTIGPEVQNHLIRYRYHTSLNYEASKNYLSIF